MTLLQKSFDGRYLRLDGELYRVLGQEPGKPSMVLESSAGERFAMHVSDFRTHIALGNVSEAGEPEFGARLRSHEESEEMAFRRYVLAHAARFREEGHTWPVALQRVRERLIREERFLERLQKFPKVRAVQIWRAEFTKRGSKALYDKRDNSGNRNDRHDRVFENIVFDLLEDQYLGSDRITVTSLCRQAKSLYLARCKEDGLKPAPHGRKVVESLIAELPHADVVKSRLGSKEARKRLLQAGRFQSIRAPFDRVEIDSTEADIFVIIDRDGATARPWITVAIDAATGLIVGLLISLERPTGMTTALTLREAMTPTEESFFERYGIESRLQAYGNLLTVVADQGSENKGDLIRRLISQTGIEYQLTIPAHPEKKPFVERLNRTLSDFIMQLPGATKTAEMPAKTRTNRAREEAALTFEEFVETVQRWRFDV